ncbi:hypothetical protein MAR_005846 [Mya arenaria]|uniref:Uncharacterized protein n=1 Tax=Mya arenaria TaxID=6604 RepID=A0ABY7F4L2_MYAAR|nr:hypothetical protein MAR_005846 [Mya arenaria]
MSVIGRCVFLKRRKVNEIHTIEIVENHSDTSSDNGVLHIATEGVQYAVVQRQAATQRIETQQSHDVDSLTYAELDIKFLQEANARVPPRRKNTPTEYADIEFFLTQESAVDDPVYHKASISVRPKHLTRNTAFNIQFNPVGSNSLGSNSSMAETEC